MLLNVLPLVLLGALSPTPSAQEAKAGGPPAWILEEEKLPGLAAVGGAMPNTSLDRSQQRSAAVSDARLKFAQRVETQVKERALAFHRAAGEKAQGIDLDYLAKIAGSAAKALVTGKLGRLNPEKMWNNPDDRSLWVLIQVLPPAADKAMAESLATALKDEIAAGHAELAPVLDEVVKAKP
jgi:hypothetical protein